jgi:hypothetical protein
MHEHGGRRTPARPPRPSRRRRWLHLAGLAGAVLALTLAVAACGGGGGKARGVASLSGANKPTATTSASGSDPRQAMLNFARCMRQHGIDVPDPKPGGGIEIKGGGGPGTAKPDAPKFRAAQQACNKYLPNGGQPPKRSPQEQQQLLAFARCMRQHGINMADPKPDGGIEIRGGPGGVNPDSPTFKAAQQACQQYQPKGGKQQTQSNGGGQ